MGNGRKRRRLERSPNSTSPSTAPSRRGKLDGETCVTEVEGQRETEQADGVVMERREGGGAVEGEKETQETKEFSFSFMNSLWDSLSNEEKWWSAHPDQVQKFARDKLKNPLLAELVLDMIKFYRIHDKLQFWFCPLCRVYFVDGDSLTMHLRKQHFLMIGKCRAWLLPYQRDLKFASVQEAICKMVWKPIDVERAVQQFYTLCLDSELEAVMGSQGELGVGWPLSDNDSDRSQLLLDLGRELKALVFHKTGLLFLSSGLLQHLIAVASWHILIRLPSRDHMLHFTRRLVCSPISFRFLDKDALFHFIRVAKRISQLARNEDLDLTSAASCTLNEVGLCEMSEKVPPQFEISTLMLDQIHFFLKPANGDYQSMRSWLHDKPSDIPCSGPLQESSHIPSFLTHISVLSAACRQLTEILGESISFFNETEVLSVVSQTSYYSIVSKWLCEALEKGCSDVENSQLSDCFSKPALEKTRNEYLTKTDELSLRVVELFCVLESWEFKVRRLCAFDFRSILLPLMQWFFQSRSSLSSKEICTEEFNYEDHRNKSSGFAGYTKLSDFQDVKKEYNSMAACGTWDTDNSGLFFCVTEGDLMQVIDNWEIEDLVEEAISHVRIHKTWRYWFCYICRERFDNPESHMKHMDNEHKLSLPCDEQSGLIPRTPSKHEIDRLLGLEEMLIESSLKAFPNNEGDHMEKRALLKRMKELLYTILDKKPVLFSASSHLVHLVEFARVELFRDLTSDKKNLVVAREIDESSQLVFSMFNVRCLCRVVKFLENLCKQCIPPQMQSPESNDITRIASYGIFYADNKFQVDPAKFTVSYFQAQETMNEEELSFVSKPDKLVEIVERLEQEIHSLRWHFNTKREVLGQLDVVFALDRMLITESDHAGTLRGRYEMLDSMDPAAQNSFQHHLISRVLHKDSSSRSIEEALEDEKDKLLSQLDNLDVQIMQELAQVDELKRDLSELCFCDYSAYILPFIGVFLNPRIRLNAGIRYWANNRLQELLLSIDHSDLSNESANFRITSVSIGKVLVNITASKWGLGFDYRGMRLNFEGEWSFLLQGKSANGYIDFSGLSDWHCCRNEHIQAKSEVVVFIGGMQQNTEDLAPSLKEAVCAKLLEFQSEFIKKSTPKIPTRWYDGDGARKKVPLPFPNEPFHGEDPMKNMNADCKKHETSKFHRLIDWKWMQWRKDMYNL